MQPSDCAPTPFTKILGGNAAFVLSAFSGLPPFFSSSYIAGDELFLSRGEDTVLSLGIKKSGLVCTDIKLFPFHDTYCTDLEPPDLLGDPKVQERLYFACTGWIGRNPFLNYLRGGDISSIREFQRERLAPGAEALAKYTSNSRYLNLLRNFDISWDSLGRYIDEHELLLRAWEEFIERCEFK